MSCCFDGVDAQVINSWPCTHAAALRGRALTTCLHCADLFGTRPADQVATMAGRGHQAAQLGRHGAFGTLELLFYKRAFIELFAWTPRCFIAAACATHDCGRRRARGPRPSRVRFVHGAWASAQAQRRASMAISSMIVLLRMHGQECQNVGLRGVNARKRRCECAYSQGPWRM